MNPLEIQSKVIKWMRFPLAVAIVFLHCSSSPCDTDTVYSFVRQYISVTLVGVAVPIFFFISGFLFFNNVIFFSKQVYIKKLQSRFRTLFIPYISWNVIVALIPFLILVAIVIKNGEPVSLLSDYLQNLIGWHIFWDYNHWGEFASGPIDLPLWFIRDLMILCLITPLIYFSIMKLDRVFVLFAIVIYLISYKYYLHFNTRAFLFFSLGAYFALRNINLVNCTRKKGVALGIITVTLSVILTVLDIKDPWSEWLYQVFVVFSLFTLIKIGSVVINKGHGNMVISLSQTSFFIYAVHEVKVAEICCNLSNTLFPTYGTASLILHYFFYPISVVILCLGLYFVLKNLTPRILFFLIGNRAK